MRIGLVQNQIVLPTTDSIAQQKDALLNRIKEIIRIAAEAGVRILCLQEAWSKYKFIIFIFYHKGFVDIASRTNLFSMI